MKTIIKYTIGAPVMAMFLTLKFSFNRSEFDVMDSLKLLLCMGLMVGYVAAGTYVVVQCGVDVQALLR